MKFRPLALVLLAALLAGCTETTVLPSEPVVIPPPVELPEEPEEDPVNINGQWVGIMTDQGAAFVGTVWNGSITQAGASFSGTWATATGLVGVVAGAVEPNGRMSGAYTYTDAAGSCSGRLDGVATDAKLDFAVTAFVGACAPVPTVLQVVAHK